MGKHVMLSYQWNKQELAEQVYQALRSLGINAWMDVHGGVKGNINDSMAAGVDGAAAICCFMTTDYFGSKNCKKELNYADAQTKAIVPLMCEKGFKATGWLGIITAGLLWIDFREGTIFENSIESLAKEIINSLENDDDVKMEPSEMPEEDAEETPQIDIRKKPGRAFLHKLTGKFLAESGQVKFHQASGSRSTLVLRDEAAQERLAVVITDAPCHGKAYSGESHDEFCDKETGLTCTGTPEVPLLKLGEQNVQVVIMHTGSSGATKMCQKLLQTSPTMIHEKVTPSQTADRLVTAMDKKLQVPPLTYVLKPFTQQGLVDVAVNHELELQLGSEATKHRVGHDGLLWVGKPSSKPKVSVKRPAHAGLDEWWEQAAEEPVELPYSFDPDAIYTLTMPLKKKEVQMDTNAGNAV